MKKQLLLLPFLFITFFSLSQTTYVPDDNFEQTLIDLGYDDVLDDYVLTTNINAVTLLEVESKEIFDLTGIEGFAALKTLKCGLNQLTSLDVSQNSSLTHLDFIQNQLINIDLTQNLELTFLNCWSNQLTSLDVTQNINLSTLWCDDNQYSNIDLTQNVALNDLYIGSSQFTEIDLTQNTLLEFVRIYNSVILDVNLTQNTALKTLTLKDNNLLANIDVTQNSDLVNIFIYSDLLTSIDLTQNIDLIKLDIHSDQLSTIDLSQNVKLEDIRCGGNQLSLLDLTNNPNLIWFQSGNSQISEIDFSQNIKLGLLTLENSLVSYLDLSFNSNLVHLNVSDNSLLKSINSKNGVNSVNFRENVTTVGDSGAGYSYFGEFNTLNCSNLTCVQVDDVIWSTESWTNIDSQTSFSEDCSDFQLSICDDNGDGVSTFDLTSLTAEIIAAQPAGSYALTYHILSTDAANGVNEIATPNAYTNTNNPQTIFARIEDDSTGSFVISLISLSSIVHPTAIPELEICDEDLDGFASFDLEALTEEIVTNEDVIISYYNSNTNAQNQTNALVSPFTNILANIQTIYMRSQSNIDSNCFEISSINLVAIPCVNITYVPDDNFEQALIDLGYDDVLDNYVLTANIDTITNLNVDSKEIADLTGIADFAALKVLSCKNNNLTSLTPALTDNYVLNELYCSNNLLEALDISKTLVLLKLNCSYNRLTSLNFDNTALMELYCTNNRLTYLLLPQQGGIYLSKVDCSNNQISLIGYLFLNNSVQELICNNNQLSNLDLSYNSNLQKLSCYNNQLTELNVGNTNLTFLNCNNNQLTSLNVKNGNSSSFTYFNALNNSDLYCIQVSDSEYSTINWTNVDAQISFSGDCSALTNIPDDNFEQELIDLGYDLILDDYVLTSNISNISTLDLSSKSINDLAGIEDFIGLTFLNVNGNNLTSLDISQNILLTEFSVNNNQLLSLNVNNGNNINFTVFDTTSNSELYCIQVDDATWSAQNWTNIDSQISFSTDCATLTYVPDNNFEQALIDLGYDFVLDDYVLTSNISGITDLNLSSKSINDLTGIQDFLGLVNFDCSNNNVVTFNISNSINLATLNVSDNNLSVFSVFQNNYLSDLNVQNNQLINLNVKNGNNTNFTTFNATGNPPLTCIEVDSITWSSINWTNIDAQTNFSEDCGAQTYVPDDNFEQALIDLGYDSVLDDYVLTSNINNPSVTSLNVSNKNISDLTGINSFVYLEDLNCSNNQLQTLGLGYFDDLKTLDCSYNQLTTLQSGSNWYLEKLFCNNNQIETLILTLNFSLIEFNCNNNNLTELIIKNETNEIITNFSALNNPNLTCISVDAVDYSSVNWTNVDTQTSFSEFCESTYTYIPDTNFEQALNDLGYDDGVLDNHIFTSSIRNITNLGVSSLGIADLTGIEDFESLRELDCIENQLTSLDLSQNIELTRVHCQYNQLTSLDLENNLNLGEVICEFNLLTSLTFGNNSILSSLYCRANQFVELDMSGLSNLQYFDCNENQLTTLNLQNGNNINMDAYDFNTTGNPDLTCILVDDIEFANDNWTNVDPQTSFSLNCIDDDGDGVPDDAEDINGNGNPTDDDTDGDGIPDFLDIDDDGDSVETIDEITDSSGKTTNAIDTDNDGIPNYLDNDDDGDGVLSINEDYNNNGDLTDDDINNNGVPDYLDNTVALSVDETSLFEFMVYPNPFEDTFNINIEQEGVCKLYTINGQIIMVGEFEIGNNTINVKSIKSGVYFVELETSKGRVFQKLIKQ